MAGADNTPRRLADRPWQEAALEVVTRFSVPFGGAGSGGPYVRASMHVDALLASFVLATFPNLCIGLWNFGAQTFSRLELAGNDLLPGWQAELLVAAGATLSPDNIGACVLFGLLYFLPLLATSLTVAIVWETLFARLRGRYTDPGWLMTSWLFVLLLPATAPPLLAALGLSFGLVFGKHVFGGTGKYLVSPALLGIVFLYFGYPAVFSEAALLPGGLADASTWQSVSELVDLSSVTVETSWAGALFGREIGPLGTGSALGCIIGGLLLVYRGAGSYRIMLGALLGLSAASLLLPLSASDGTWQLAWYWHAVLGTFAFAAIFIATDPTTSPVTPAGRWIFGAMIGAMTAGIRTLNPDHPDAALAVVLMASLFVPAIDHLVVRFHVRRLNGRFCP